MPCNDNKKRHVSLIIGTSTHLTKGGQPCIVFLIEKQRLGTRLVGLKAKPREPGKVRAGASAEVEWTRELQTERGIPK